MGVVGLDMDEYFKSTLKQLTYKSKAHEFNTKMFKGIEFAMYDSQYGGMSGKKVFKAEWLKKRFAILFEKEKVLNADEANKLIQEQFMKK